MPTLDDAKHCPKCGQVGSIEMETKGRAGSKIYNVNCQNEICTWFETGWVVQVKADGTLAERQAGPKQFEKLNVYQEKAAQAIIDEVKER